MLPKSRVLKCEICGLPVDSRYGRYLLLIWAWRGRTGDKEQHEVVLCPLCGSVALHEITALLISSAKAETAAAGR
jgi:hypothetical protein